MRKILFLLALLFLPALASAGLPGYANVSYYQFNTTAGALTDFPIARFTLNTQAMILAGTLQPDCDDIRVTDVVDSVLPYRVTSCNTTTTQVWFRGTYNADGLLNVSLQLNNPLAVNQQDGRSTFSNNYSAVYLLDRSLSDELGVWNASCANGPGQCGYTLDNSTMGYGLRIHPNQTGAFYVKDYNGNLTGVGISTFETTYDVTDSVFIGTYWMADSAHSWKHQITAGSNPELDCQIGASSYRATANVTIPLGARYLQQTQYTGSLVQTYVNGTLRAITNAAGVLGYSSKGSNCLVAGYRPDGNLASGACNSGSFTNRSQSDALINYMLISNVSRTPQWLYAEQNFYYIPITLVVPTLSRINQTPSDINTSNFINGVTTFWEALNASNAPQFNFGVGSSTQPSSTWYYINGTGFGGWLARNTSNVTNYAYSNTTYRITLGDNSVSPATYAVNPDVYFVVSGAYNLTTANDAISFKLYNLTDTTYSFVEFMANNYTSGANDLQVYVRNSSCFNAASGPSYCSLLIGSIPAGSAYNHCHNNTNHCHHVVYFNASNNRINGLLNISPTMEFQLRPQLSSGADWSVYYFPVTAYSGQTRTTSTGGSTYVNQTFTVDGHAHQFQGTQAFVYYINATANGVNTNSTIWFDYYDLSPLPPSSVLLTNPGAVLSNHTFVNESINFTNASTATDSIITYNVTVESIDRAIVYERLLTNSTLNYTTWNASKLNSGSYFIVIIATGWPSALSSASEYPVLLYAPTSVVDAANIESAYHNYSYSLPVGLLVDNYIYANITINGSMYPGVVGGNVASYDYFIPAITTASANLPFNWTVSFNATNGSILTYTTETQNTFVEQMNISACSNGNYTLNVTFIDESTGSVVTSPYVAYRIEYTNFQMRGNLTKYLNATITPASGTLYFCLAPSYGNLTGGLFFQYSKGGAGGYSQREFTSTVNLTNQTQLLNLYMLNTTLSNEVIITVVDGVNAKVAGITVKAQRWIPGNNSYLTVASGTSDYKGEIILQLQAQNQYYRFLLEEAGAVVKTINPYVIVCQSGAYCPPYRVTLQINLADNPPIFEQAGSLSSNCSFVNSTGYLICFTNDATGLSTRFELIVTRKEAVSWNATCSITCVSSSCVMPCLLGNHTGRIYEYTLYSTTNEGGTLAIQHGFLDFTNARVSWDFNGLLLALLITLSLAVSTAWNPSAALLAGAAGIVFGFVAGLLPVSIGSLIGFLLVIGVLAWNTKS